MGLLLQERHHLLMDTKVAAGGVRRNIARQAMGRATTTILIPTAASNATTTLLAVAALDGAALGAALQAGIATDIGIAMSLWRGPALRRGWRVGRRRWKISVENVVAWLADHAVACMDRCGLR